MASSSSGMTSTSADKTLPRTEESGEKEANAAASTRAAPADAKHRRSQSAYRARPLIPRAAAEHLAESPAQPSNAAWWASYATAQRLIWRAIGPDHQNNHASVMAVQGASAAAVGGVAALVTMPLDTVKTRLQVVDVGARPTSLARSLKPKDIGILIVNCSLFSPTPSLSVTICSSMTPRE